MHRSALRAAALAVLALIGIGAAPVFDSKPWLEDFAQVKAALIAKYANLEWAVTDRGADLPALYEETRRRIAAAQNESEARAAFERFGRRIGDGHIAFLWKSADVESAEAAPVSCTGLGYNPAMNGAPLAAYAPGYHALQTPQSAEFPIGTIESGGHRIGVLKIGLFEPQGFVALCEAALTALAIPRGKPCDEDCESAVSRWAHNRLTEDLAAQLRALKAAGATVLVVDVADNGGGSEWAEAAARMLTAIPLKSERMAFVRGAHWVKRFAEYEADLRRFAKDAKGDDHELLLALADQVHAKGVLAKSRCDGEILWRGAASPCRWLNDGTFATGLLATADPAALRGKPFAQTLYTPMQYPFEPGVWDGPLIVLVDRNSYSATEEFAATLQDNHAAVIIGEPTGGAGCGHTDGGTPETLRNSGATLQMPDCVRLRADGSNEIQGIQPDILIGFTPRDGAALKGKRFAEKLSEAVERAVAAHP